MSDSTAADITAPRLSVSQLEYIGALKRVMGLANFERSTQAPTHWSFHLERMGLLMERLGNVHLSVPTIHVAGTKGKGSTAAMVTSILTAQGYKVGLYTSPHLHRAAERIRVGLEPISPQDFASLVELVWPAIESVGREGDYGEVTFFEALTAMAFLWFERTKADFQVMEVGLGGRLDSTNVVSPEVCTITSLSLDHVKTLGDTVERIAREKAGIIKRGVPVVVSPQPGEAMAVILEVADELEAPVVQVDQRMSWRRLGADLGGQHFEVEGPGGTRSLWIPLLGDHQLENAATAMNTVETLVEKGFDVSNESVARGLESVRWPARLEVLSRDRPLVVADGAHNPYSARRLVEAVHEHFDFRRAIVLFGALKGHSVNGMVSALAGLSPLVIAVRSRDPRSVESETISQLVSEHGLPVVFESEDVGEATRRALELAGHDDLVIGTGSLTVAAEVIEEIKGIEPELYPYLERPQERGAVKVV